MHELRQLIQCAAIAANAYRDRLVNECIGDDAFIEMSCFSNRKIAEAWSVYEDQLSLSLLTDRETRDKHCENQLNSSATIASRSIGRHAPVADRPARMLQVLHRRER
jgi:hypothetical protein